MLYDVRMVAMSTILGAGLLLWCMMETSKNIESPALGCMVGRAYQIMLGQLAAALKDAGLDMTTGEYLVLRAVYSKEGMQQCEIADMVGKDKASVCRCVAAMEKKGLLATEAGSHKCLRVYLTEKSRGIEQKVIAVADLRHQALAQITTPAELEIFTRIIEKIISSK